MATDYSNPGGSGDRRGSIVITVSSITSVSGLLSYLVNGSSANEFYIKNQSAVDKWIMFDFGSTASKVIDEIALVQSGTHTHGYWQAQACNDATSWNNIGSTFVLGGSTRAISTSMSTNTSGYRYYRLLGVSGNATNTPYIQEIEFKIDNYTAPASKAGLFFCHG